MPFTPFHFGPGTLVKSFMQRHFNFSIFVFTQIIIDLETLYFILKEEFPVHRLLHTYLGSNVVVLAALVLGRPTCQWIIKTKLRLSLVLTSSMIGAYSHVFLDSIMHSDLRPFRPFSDANPMFRMIDVGLLHLLCIFSGVIGVGIWLLSITQGKNKNS